jgi:hypothetical protein
MEIEEDLTPKGLFTAPMFMWIFTVLGLMCKTQAYICTKSLSYTKRSVEQDRA